MSFVYRNVAVIGVVLAAVVPAWLYGGADSRTLVPVMPWVLAFLAEAFICFPQREDGETGYDARVRVWENLRKDPLTWFIVGFFVLLMVPFANQSLCPVCDAAAIAGGASGEPPVKFLPFCVNWHHHLGVVTWFVPALVAALATKHALTRAGKRMAIEMIVWDGVLLAALGLVQQVAGAHGPLWAESDGPYQPYFFSTFGYPNMGADYFAALFALSMSVWRWRCDEFRRSDGVNAEGRRGTRHARFWARHYPLIAAAILYFASLYTLSRAGIVIATAAAAILFVHTGMSHMARLKRIQRVKTGAFFGLVVVGILVIASVITPEEVDREVKTLDTVGVLNRVTGKGEYHTRVSVALLRDHMLFGCGGWGYMHLSPTKFDKEKRNQLQTVGGANVHNDYLQFLCEHGIVGFVLLVTISSFLLWPLAHSWKVRARTVRFGHLEDKIASPRAIFALPAPAFCVVIALLGTFVHAFADCPLRSSAVLTLFFFEMAAVDGYLPEISESEVPHKRHKSREKKNK